MFFKTIDPKKVDNLMPGIEQPFLNKNPQPQSSEYYGCTSSNGGSCPANGCTYHTYGCNRIDDSAEPSAFNP